MTTLILGVCALACPLLMVSMMWMMRGRERGRHSDEKKD